MKKLMSLCLAFVMVLSMAACGDTNVSNQESNVSTETTSTSETVESTEEVKEPVTISLYPVNANLTSGTVGGWLGEYLLEQGIILEVWPYSEEKLSAILTGGDLPDILYLPKDAELATISESGLLLDLEAHMDKLPHIAGNEKLQTAIDYTKEYVTDGTLTMMPLRVGANATSIDTERAAVKINWEAYKKIGSPEIKSFDHLIEVLKEMQEATPTSAIGEKTYGAHLFNSSDKEKFQCMQNWFAVTGYDASETKYFVEVDLFNEKFDYTLADDSNYKAGLAYFNKLYREGLVEPDSITKDRNTQNASIENGGALAGWAAAPGWEQWGYYPVYFEGVKTGADAQGYPFGSGDCIAVSAKTENLDTVLKFLDMLADPDALIVMNSGPQGELWDVNADGKAVLTQKGIDQWINGVTAKINGEEYALFNTQYILNVGELTSYGTPWSMSDSEEAVMLMASSETFEEWKTLTGYENYLELLKDKDAIVTETFYANAARFAEGANEEQSMLMAAAKEIIVPASWKMIYAETDAEFEEIWAAAVKDCEALGVKAIYEWRKAELEKGVDIIASLKK